MQGLGRPKWNLLVCVIIAGVLGGIMIKPTIPLFQSLLAMVALTFVLRSSGPATSADRNLG